MGIHLKLEALKNDGLGHPQYQLIMARCIFQPLRSSPGWGNFPNYSFIDLEGLIHIHSTRKNSWRFSMSNHDAVGDHTFFRWQFWWQFFQVCSWTRVLDEAGLGRLLLLICRIVDHGFNVNDCCLGHGIEQINSGILCGLNSIAAYTGPNSSAGRQLKGIMNLASTSTTSSIASEKTDSSAGEKLNQKETLKRKHPQSSINIQNIWDALIGLHQGSVHCSQLCLWIYSIIPNHHNLHQLSLRPGDAELPVL